MGELEPYILGPCTVRICFSGIWNRTFLNFVRLGSSFQGVGTVHFQVCVRLDYLFLEMEPYHGLTVYCLVIFRQMSCRTVPASQDGQSRQTQRRSHIGLPGFLKRIHSSGIMQDLFIFDRPGRLPHQKYQNLFDALDIIYHITKQIISLFFFSLFH